MTTSTDLKAKLATQLMERLDKGEPNKDGDIEPAKAATLTVVLNFLKQYPVEDENLPQSATTSDMVKNMAGHMKFARDSH